MDKILQIKTLRKQGLTIREIAERTGIPRSTIHKMLENVQVKGEPETEVEPEVDIDKLQLIHLPYIYFCPRCGREQNHVFLCLECGKFLPADCLDDACYEEAFDLSQVKRKQE